MESADWREARLSTHFVDEHPELLAEEFVPSAEAAAVAAVLLQEQCTASSLIRRVRLANPTAQGR